MHFFVHSINKYHSDYIKCDDPNQEDQGHKWSLSALLRHLKANGIDTVQVLYKLKGFGILQRKIIHEYKSFVSCFAGSFQQHLCERGSCGSY